MQKSKKKSQKLYLRTKWPKMVPSVSSSLKLLENIREFYLFELVTEPTS